MGGKTTLRCTGRDGQEREFDVSWKEDPFSDTWHFRVSANPPIEEVFELTLERCPVCVAKVIMISANDCDAYRARGIPDALLPYASRELGLHIRSSTNNPEVAKDGERRTPSATAMWARLVAAGTAVFDPAHDIYWIPCIGPGVGQDQSHLPA